MKGLSFSAPMVKAWLAGTKSITRRLMNPQPPITGDNGGLFVEVVPSVFLNRGDLFDFRYELDNPKAIKSPYLPGETVYIKETWVECDIKANDDDSESIFIVYKATNDMRPDGVSCEDFGSGRWVIRPEEEIDKFRHNIEKMEVFGTKWRPPRFMFEWAARSHALVVSVRPERVQEITEEDAIKEGVITMPDAEAKRKWGTKHQPRMAFADLWDTLHPGSWERNDFIWRIELKRV